jgi:tRNA A37 threonylcarbamoyladenosine biosynthesis protein TsaE
MLHQVMFLSNSGIQVIHADIYDTPRSYNPTRQIFGLGSLSQVDTLTIEWPDGQQTFIQAIAAN